MEYLTPIYNHPALSSDVVFEDWWLATYID